MLKSLFDDLFKDKNLGEIYALLEDSAFRDKTVQQSDQRSSTGIKNMNIQGDAKMNDTYAALDSARDT